MAGSGSSKVRTSIFSGENYEFWRIKMVTIFKSYGLQNLVEKGIPIPDSKKKKTTEEASEDDDGGKMADIFMKDAKALGIIQNAISNEIFPRIANADSAKMAWELLYGEYHGGDHVLISLSKVHDPIRLVIENIKSLETVELQEVVAILKSQEQRFELHNVDTAEKAFASFSVSPKDQNKGGTQSGSSKFQKRECTASKNVQKANCANQVEVTGNLFYANSIISGASANGEWYIDSGCSSHMTGDKKLLVDIRTNMIGKVQMPTGELVDIARMGTLVIDTSKGRKHIKEVMYHPGLKENLLSVGQMDEHGYYLLFGGKICSIFDRSSLDSLVIKVEMKRNYPLALLPNDHIALNASVSHSTWTWHKSLGHLHLRGMNQLKEKEMVHGLPYLEKVDEVCEGHQLGKQHREWFPNNQAWRASNPLELIHVDLWGPMKNESIAGNNYFMLLIDDCTRMI
ncbi:hypothetical protein L3X38_031584 [Prunus dulcis]|uniref:GAG-pre-integrase domain-containing protein n=1 Tax=Prunus dulcis TaxID=3755 RepID=A0AAD4VDX1_PRUDU|nr:hypothetical protein L3X38_031584 [Prunus dulcis]